MPNQTALSQKTLTENDSSFCKKNNNNNKSNLYFIYNFNW